VANQQIKAPADLDPSYDNRYFEKEVLRGLIGSSVVRRYDSKEELEFEVKLRARLSRLDFDFQKAGIIFESRVGLVADPGDMPSWQSTGFGGIELKPGCKAADAVREIFNPKFKKSMECASALYAGYLLAVLDVLGDDRFNLEFSYIRIQGGRSSCNFALFEGSFQDPTQGPRVPPKDQRWEMGDRRRYADYQIGDWLYFQNPDVRRDHLWWRGENVVKVLPHLYYGFGGPTQTARGWIDQLNAERMPARVDFQRMKFSEVQDAYLADEARRVAFWRLFQASKKRFPRR
jgi:protein-glutamine gamma-glutamyltransferase